MGIQSHVSLLHQKKDISLLNQKRLKRIERLVQGESILTNDLLTHLVKCRLGFDASFRTQMIKNLLHLSDRVTATMNVFDGQHKILAEAPPNSKRPTRLVESVTVILGRLLLEIHAIIDVMLKTSHQGRSEYHRLKRIEAYLLKGFEMVEDLLYFTRHGSFDLQPITRNDLVEAALDTYFAIQMPIRINLSVADNVSAVKADPRLMRKIFLHLFMNAGEAMPGGGDLFFDVSQVTCGNETATSEDPKPGVYLLLTIRDTGQGMAADTLDHAFEPFFTSKTPCLGRGLGLPCSLGIVNTLGGTVKAWSYPGQGTTIKIYLPVHESKKRMFTRKALNWNPAGWTLTENIGIESHRYNSM
jgi:signal transduction histidine kinase